MAIQTKTMMVKSDTAFAETKTTIRDTVTFDTSKLPNGITYKGLKAVLSFADPIQWNKASTYDALTVVWDDATHASYASKRRVPQNIELTNELYWFRTADLDAQVEMYRQEVQQFDGRITANEQAIATETARTDALFSAFNGKKAVVYGDSTVFKKPSYIETFGNLVGMSVVNKSIAGTSVTPSTYSAPSNSLYGLLKNESAVTFVDIDYVFLCYGTNDWQGSARLFDCGDEKHNTSFEYALKKCYDMLLKFNSKLKIVFVSPVFAHRQFLSSMPNINAQGFKLEDYSYIAEKVTHEYGMLYCGLNSLGVNEDNYREWLLDDSGGIFVHYNEDLKNEIVNYLIHSFPWKSEKREIEKGKDSCCIARYAKSTVNVYKAYDSNFEYSVISPISSGKKVYTAPIDLHEGARLNGLLIFGSNKVKIYAKDNPDSYVIINTHEFTRVSVPIEPYNGECAIVIENTGATSISFTKLSITSKLGCVGDISLVPLSNTPDNVRVCILYQNGEYTLGVLAQPNIITTNMKLATLDSSWGDNLTLEDKIIIRNNEIFALHDQSSLVNWLIKLPAVSCTNLG
jgi:hypothetical protein